VDRISAQVLAMVKEVEAQLFATTNRLESMGRAPPSTAGEQRSEFTALAYKFGSLLTSSASLGSYLDEPLASNESIRIRALARLAFDELQQGVNEIKPDFDSTDYKTAIIRQLSASKGKELPGFLNPSVFEQLVGLYLGPWGPLSLECLDKIEVASKKTAEVLASFVAGRYPALQSMFRGEAAATIGELSLIAKNAVLEALQCELHEVYTQNHYLLDTVNKIRTKRFSEGLQSMLSGIAVFTTPATSALDKNGQKILLEAVTQVQMAPTNLAEQITSWYMKNIGVRSLSRRLFSSLS
jgi:hypothetical protein